jgi:hypothetical protein
MIVDISLDGVSHENDPMQSPDTVLAVRENGYPSMTAYCSDNDREVIV